MEKIELDEKPAKNFSILFAIVKWIRSALTWWNNAFVKDPKTDEEIVRLAKIAEDSWERTKWAEWLTYVANKLSD